MDYLLQKIRDWGFESVAQYQEHWRPVIDSISGYVNGRPINVDGEIGAATASAILQRDCDCPDFIEGRAIELATWPTSCRRDVGLYLDPNSYRASLGLSWKEIVDAFQWACDQWNQVIDIRFHITNDFDAAKCYVKFDSLSGSVLGWSHLANNTCADDKQQRYDYRQWNLHQFRMTVLHELGHLLGLPHQTGNYVMNATILTHLQGLTSNDIRRARGLGYGEPTQPPVPPVDPPPTDPPAPTEIDYVRLADLIFASMQRQPGEFIGPPGDRGPAGTQGRRGEPGRGMNDDVIRGFLRYLEAAGQSGWFARRELAARRSELISALRNS